jgi:hypothetical protein
MVRKLTFIRISSKEQGIKNVEGNCRAKSTWLRALWRFGAIQRLQNVTPYGSVKQTASCYSSRKAYAAAWAKPSGSLALLALPFGAMPKGSRESCDLGKASTAAVTGQTALIAANKKKCNYFAPLC